MGNLKTLIVLLALAFVAFAAKLSGEEVKEIVLKAKAELDAELEQRPRLKRSAEDSARSRRGRKFTARSRAMEYRNELNRRAKDIAEARMGPSTPATQFVVEKQILEQIENTITDPNLNQGQTPGGQSPMTGSINSGVWACSKNFQPTCNPNQRFRTISGICNNLQNTRWGASDTQLGRVLDATYADFYNQPRGTGFSRLTMPLTTGSMFSFSCDSQPGSWLPNPRRLSRDFHAASTADSAVVTHAFTIFAQYLDHDLSFTPELESEDDCCSAQHMFDSECLGIFVPTGDGHFGTNHASTTPLPLFGGFGRSLLNSAEKKMSLNPEYLNRQYGTSSSGVDPTTVNCIAFTRSVTFCKDVFGSVREQMNGITSYVDASNLYGSHPDDASELRSGVDGLMKVTLTSTGKELLPKLPDDSGTNQFKGGDVRARENPALSAYHTLFLREHNRLARQIKIQIPWWNDNRIFEAAREVLIAEWQHIVYSEFLAVLLGTNSPWANGAQPYNASVDASITNSFATAAYRFGHSLVQGLHSLFHVPANTPAGNLDLKTNFFESAVYEADNGEGMERLLNGLMRQNAKAYDPAVTAELTNHLFENNNNGLGSDLAARNINRGRDHGLPSYNDFREFCGPPKSCGWNSKPAEISQDKWDQLMGLYTFPMDIDLFVGGLAEDSAHGGILGKTFSCLVSKQFSKLMVGDRFFYTHQTSAPNGPRFPFNNLMINEIQKRTLGSIICDNTDITQVRENVFLENSPFIDCSQTNRLNIRIFLH